MNLKNLRLRSLDSKKYLFTNAYLSRLEINVFFFKILSVSTVSSHQSKYNLKDDSKVLDTLTSTEVYSLRVSLRSQAGASVISRQYIRLNSTYIMKKYC